MNVLTAYGILKKAHDMIGEVFMNAMDKEEKLEVFEYAFGINDFANELIKQMELDNVE